MLRVPGSGALVCVCVGDRYSEEMKCSDCLTIAIPGAGLKEAVD